MRNRIALELAAMAAILAATVPAGSAQGRRLTDDQVKELMEETEKDVERFTKSVQPQYRTSTLRTATSEVSVEAYLADLKKSCKNMRERFDDDYAASNEVLACLRQAGAIDRRSSSGGGLFGGEKEWPRLKGTLGRLAQVYGVDRTGSPDAWTSRRMNDRELVSVIEGLSNQTKSFKKSLESALEHVPSLGKEERKTAFDAIERLEGTADDLKGVVEDGKDSAGELSLLKSASQQIQGFLSKHGLANSVGSTWGPLSSEISRIVSAF
jgi:hypothetical protein